jgi:hypothetical protein
MQERILKRLLIAPNNQSLTYASIASTSESPRAYEVLSTMMKTIVEANHGLLDIHKSVKKLKEED